MQAWRERHCHPLNPAFHYPPDLPVSGRREDILACLRQHQVLVLAGETGSGKTTQLPKMCLEALGEKGGIIGCTQPRRVAALSVSQRVAEELQLPWGGLVGCKIRFSDNTCAETRVKFMTDGILLNEIQHDPLLRAYGAIILDEAHERSLNIDFLLGFLKTLLPKRPDLRVLVSSATIDVERFARHFEGAQIIEVSGRTHPVEIQHLPSAQNQYGLCSIEAVADACAQALSLCAGDVLAFLPTERDIHECRDLLQGQHGAHCEVLGLFGRMPTSEQQRIFSPGPKRRIILATNVAETSLTVPRIAAVVDSGLARQSRYNPRTRTKRLPVEPISQSSANQRAGRAGRLGPGLCLRLFDAAEHAKRPLWNIPEIQRCNLADVILRLKAYGLGRIEDFPLMQPPSSAAIAAGYELLAELGALDESRELTALGRELAKLPLDPTLGRMLIEAQRLGCLEDMTIVAAGLSIADPRERPQDKLQQARDAQRLFAAPQSDVLSLLKIWELANPAASRNALRRFCRDHFLSMVRMLEWRDIWNQLKDALRPQPPDPAAQGMSREAAIARCVLAGHLGNLGQWQERNLYRGAQQRLLHVFPGSQLFERERQGKKGKGNPSDPKPKTPRQPPWMVATEVVETSRLFARGLCPIDPAWALELGAHLIKRQYAEPHWSQKAGRVLITEKSLLHGLEVGRRKVDFGRLDPDAAREIFIREAMLDDEHPLPHRFIAHNQELRGRLEAALTRARSSEAHGIAERLFEFYRRHLHGCVLSGVADLNRLLAERKHSQPQFLFASEEELSRGEDLSLDLEQFPQQAEVANAVLPLTYAYKPGEEEDGVTLAVPAPVVEQLDDASLLWMVPGLREELCSRLLDALPRAKRRGLMPLRDCAKRMAQRLKPQGQDFLQAVAQYLQQQEGAAIEVADFPEGSQAIATHLKPRLVVYDREPSKPLVVSRDLAEVKRQLEKQRQPSGAWDLLARQWEGAIAGMDFGQLPESMLVETIGGAPVLAYPGLRMEGNACWRRLFRSAAQAEASSRPAIRELAQHRLSREIKELTRELRSLGGASAPAARGLDALAALDKTASKPADVPAQALENLLQHHLRLEPLRPLCAQRLEATCAAFAREWPTHVASLRQWLKACDGLRESIARCSKPYPGMGDDLKRLLPADVLARTAFAQLPHLPRYLRAMLQRAERFAHHPGKDRDKASLLEPWVQDQAHVPAENRETYRWLLEEYRVSLFAQELGTAQPVSPKRLEALF